MLLADFNLWPAWKTVEQAVWTVIALLPNILTGVVVFVAFLFVGRGVHSLIGRMMRKRSHHRHLGIVLGRMAQAVSIILGLLLSLVLVLPNFHPAQLVQLLGVSSVAIGFAFRDIMQNFLAGLLILITEPFRIGDQIRVDSYEGVVEDIKTRATMIRTYDNRRVVIPNMDVFTKSVTVNTAYENRRIENEFGIGYSDDIGQAKALILEALDSVPNILKQPKADVLVSAFSDSGVTLRVRWWVQPPVRSELLASQDKVLTAIKAKFNERGIDLPYPTQQILFHNQTEDADGDRRRQREGWPAKTDGNSPAADAGH